MSSAGFGPAGYSVSAESPEFRATHVREEYRDPARPNVRNPIELTPGEARTDINIALRRSLAVSGRVVDPWDQPLAGVEVFLSETFPGDRGFSDRRTDDRGMFRLFGVRPGRYFVCADSGIGNARLAIASTAPKERSLRTCYPGSTTESAAVPIVVRQADVEGLEIRMVRGLTFSVSGVVTDSRGLPPERAILELRHWTATGSGSTARSLPPDGRFTLAGLLPGDYVVAAETGELENPGERRTAEAAEARVHVEGEDVDGLTLAMAPIITVRGRLIFDDGSKPRALGSGFMVRAVGVGMADAEGGVPYTTVQPDLTFELSRILGPSTITMTNVPTGWTVQSVRYRGNDITDSPAAFTSSGDSVPLEITLSRRGGLLAGSVLDEAGAPAVRARVVLFPADADKWRNVPAGRPATTSKDGRFEFEMRRAGEYLVAAVGADEMPPLPTARFLERLSKVAERVVLGEGERRTIDLRVVKIPEDR